MISKMVHSILLEPEQQDILCAIVEAHRRTPTDKRESFSLQDLRSTSVHHPGFGRHPLNVFRPDVDMLRDEGLIKFSPSRQRSFTQFTITPYGFQYYAVLKEQLGQPTQRLEKDMRGFLDAATFQKRYPLAYQKWSDAEKLLWTADSDRQLTVIGHNCREAIQEFAEALINLHQPPETEPNKTQIIQRFRSVLALKKQQLGKAKHAFLDALLPYWGTVSDLIQRQEHGGQKEGEPLNWEDARRVVFQTMIVMYEIDNALSKI